MVAVSLSISLGTFYIVGVPTIHKLGPSTRKSPLQGAPKFSLRNALQQSLCQEVLTLLPDVKLFLCPVWYTSRGSQILMILAPSHFKG